MSSEAYVGTAKRTFQQALIHMLEADYRLVGSRRVLELMAEDVEKLVASFYPLTEHVPSGWMVFTGSEASGEKVHPGQRATDHSLRTITWPVLLAEDLRELASSPETQVVRQKLLRKRLIRLIEHGWQHPQGPVLLTLADLAAMLGLSTIQVSHLLKQAREETGKTLLTKGYYFDQGMRPTHKQEIIALYEQGINEIDIARRTKHSIKSVGRYIRDYERVRMMVAKGTPPGQVSQLLDMQPGMVKAYTEMADRYHPGVAKQTDHPGESMVT